MPRPGKFAAIFAVVTRVLFRLLQSVDGDKSWIPADWHDVGSLRRRLLNPEECTMRETWHVAAVAGW